MGSYIHDNTQIRFTGSCNHDFENQRAQQYQINITDLDREESFIMWANRNYSQTGFKVGGFMVSYLLSIMLPSKPVLLLYHIAYMY